MPMPGPNVKGYATCLPLIEAAKEFAKWCYHILLLILLLGCLASGCILLPIPTSETKVLSGRRVTDEQTSSLQVGVTTKTDIVMLLGAPDVFWEDQRIFAYNWTVRRGVIFAVIFTGAVGIFDIPKGYVLLIQFDENAVVQRFVRVTGSLSEAYREVVVKWGEQREERETVPVPPQTQVK